MMMAILTSFSYLPFFSEPANPDVFVFTLVVMLGVCICDVGFTNTRQWLMALEHPEAIGLAVEPQQQQAFQPAVLANGSLTEEAGGFGQPYAWSTQDAMETTTTDSPNTACIQALAKKMNHQELEAQFFVDGVFFGLPKKPVVSTEEGTNSASA